MAARCRLSLFLLASLLCAGCDPDVVVGSGTEASSTRQVKAFYAVETRGAMRLEVSLGKPLKVVVKGDDNLLGFFETKSNGKRLRMLTTKPVQPKSPFTAIIEAPDIKLIRTKGSAWIRVQGITGGRFQLDCDGSCKAEAFGFTQKLKVFVKGSGHVDMRKLRALEALIVVEGSGSIQVQVDKHLEARVWGSGKIIYDGSAEVVREIRGSGVIRPRSSQ